MRLLVEERNGLAMGDTLRGSTTVLVFMGAYDVALERELGDKAAAVKKGIMESVAQAQAKLIKEQTGAQELDLEAIHSIIPKLLEENMGLVFEAVEKTPSKIVYNVGRCPVYESSEMLGMDPAAIQARCHATSSLYLDALLKALNPNVSLELDSFRQTAGDHCVESFVLSQ